MAALLARPLGWARRSLPILAALLGLLAGLWASWRNVTAAGEPRPTPIANPTVPASEQVEVPLPPFRSSLSKGLPRLANPHTSALRRARVEVARYTVQPGDSVFGIAEKFGLKPETVLWGNYEVLQDDPHTLRPGQELNILPVDGTYYQWQPGDTLESVAAFFGVVPEAISEWPGNGLDPTQPEVSPGQWLVVPGGRRALRTWVVPTIARGRAGVGAAYGPGGCSGDFSGGAVGTGGFIWPAANRYLSGNNYWSGHLAIDIAAGEGAPIWAADSGVVVFAGGAYGGYGNMVMIDHGNGWQTLYAHLSVVSVTCGQNVAQGQRIGLAGSTGNSTGAHLHFETRYQGGFVNPWYVLP